MKKKLLIVVMVVFLIHSLTSSVISGTNMDGVNRLPETPVEVIESINKDMRELYGVTGNYFTYSSPYGYLREDMLSARIRANNNHFEIVYGQSHAPWLEHSQMYAYSGYTINGDSVSTEGAPWYAGWSGTKIQDFNMAKHPWNDREVREAYGFRKNRFDKYTGTSNIYLQNSNGTFEKAILTGLNLMYADKPYRNFMYNNMNSNYKDKPVYDRDAKPKLGGDWVDYVHVLQPPTNLSWGSGRIYIKGAGGITYLGIPIAPFILQSNDLSAHFEKLPSGAVAGSEVRVGVAVKSTFKSDQITDFKWNIVDGSGSAIPVSYMGHAVEPAGKLTVPAHGEQLLYANFKMPNSQVSISFDINETQQQPIETTYENNRLRSAPSAIKLVTSIPPTTNIFDLDYNVLEKEAQFPLANGASITAKLSLPSQSVWDGNATGALEVTNNAATLFRNFQVKGNPEVNEASSSITRKPTIETTFKRTDFGDDPLGRNWLNSSTPSTAKTRSGTIAFDGEVSRNYIQTIKVCTPETNDDGEVQMSCEYHQENGSTDAPFTPGSDTRTINVKIYNGMDEIQEKPYTNAIENNTINSLKKELLWKNEPYRYDVIRWMAYENAAGTLENWTAVPGQYKRTFTHQASGEVKWEKASTMVQGYKQSRDAASKMLNNKKLYDTAVFATDRQLQKYDYPIKSGYYFNPTGTYTFKVKTETFKQTQASTSNHKDLVDKVIDSFRYETNLMYINNKKAAVNIRNEPLSKSGNTLAPKAGVLTAEDSKGVNASVLLTVIKDEDENNGYTKGIVEGYSKKVEEIYHSQNTTESSTHPYWKLVLEGYAQSGTQGSFDKFKYREYVKSGQRLYKITEETTVTIAMNKDNVAVYTHAQMPDGEYYIKAWIADVELSASSNAYRSLGKLVGIKPLDEIKVTVQGSMFDDLNN